MFELWKEDQTRVRLDENSQVSSFLGKVSIGAASWSPVFEGTATPVLTNVNVPAGTEFFMFGDTGGTVIACIKITDYGSYKQLQLHAMAYVAVTVYCFGPRNVTVSSSGLQFLDTAGNVTFDAQAKWLRVAGVVPNPVFGTEYALPVGAGRTAAGYSARGHWIIHQNVGGLTAFRVLSHGIQVGTSGAKIGGIVSTGPPTASPPPAVPEPPIAPIIFADVSGY